MQLIYLCPAVRKPIGGVKVIYRHAAMADQLLATPDGACVLHPNSWRHVDRWFDSGVPQMRAWFKPRWVGKPSFSDIRGVFDPSRHKVVLTELWARKYGRQLRDAGVDYAIFVQNGYFINKGRLEDLEAAYDGARRIVTVSQDASACVAMAFPQAASRIQRIHLDVESGGSVSTAEKENLITYMPRKLSDHAEKVLFFLRPHLPANWRIEPIQNASPVQVHATLTRSKIFLSFSHFEGFGLPPLEAALHGNRVIGYTGQAGQEYWDPAIFDAVEQGDILGFVQRITACCAEWEHADPLARMASTRTELSARYSAEAERRDLRAFLAQMGFSLSA